jgi:hypothetical protein
MIKGGDLLFAEKPKPFTVPKNQRYIKELHYPVNRPAPCSKPLSATGFYSLSFVNSVSDTTVSL